MVYHLSFTRFLPVFFCVVLFSFSSKTRGNWVQVGSDIDGESVGDHSGYSVSLSSDGSTVAVGAAYNDGRGENSGHVRIFNYNTDLSAWTQVGSDIDGESLGDISGQSVSLSSDGTRIAIGAKQNDGNGSNSGQVRIYSYDVSSSTWTQVGSDIDGESAGDLSGIVSLSADGSTVAIGGVWNDGNGERSGHVRIFGYDSASSTWTQIGSDIEGKSAGDLFGFSVSLSSDGSTVAIGAATNDGNGADSGHVRIYGYDSSSSTWIQVGSDIDGESEGFISGVSVSLSSDGTRVAIGARGSDYINSNSGRVRIFEYASETNYWTQIGLSIDGEFAGDLSGNSVSLSIDGLTVAIGAHLNGGNGTESGHARIYSFDSDGDLVPDRTDTDDDNDGVLDTADAFPLDSSESIDTDIDGTGNNADTDDDGDGVTDTADAFPLDSSESVDTDGDSTGNNADTDDDGDGVADTADAFPLNSSESVDTDGDGTGNNADADDDGDGVADTADAFPLDSSESVDTDEDGTGNNADTDDDNDGVADTADAFPLDSSESVDTDRDGVGNNTDTDDDGDGIGDESDAFPFDSSESVDTDRDGVGNNADVDADGDGFTDDLE